MTDNKSAYQFVNIQRRLNYLYENGHKMEPEYLQRTVDGLVGATVQMVRYRKESYLRDDLNSPLSDPCSTNVGSDQK
jgi:hypothetical protein